MPLNDKKSVLLFDIDFTLLTSDGAGRVVIEKTFLELFGKTNVWRDIDASGKTDLAIFQEISRKELGRELSCSEEQLVVMEYVKNYRASFMKQNPFHALPGVAELLDRLVDNENCVVGIQTGNIEDIGELKLRGADIHHYFSFAAYCASFYDKTDVVRDAKSRLKEQGICAEEIIVIGDSPRDIAAGQSNQCRTIAVATGRFSEDALREAGADCVLPDLRDADLFLRHVFSLSSVRA